MRSNFYFESFSFCVLISTVSLPLSKQLASWCFLVWARPNTAIFTEATGSEERVDLCALEQIAITPHPYHGPAEPSPALTLQGRHSMFNSTQAWHTSVTLANPTRLLGVTGTQPWYGSPGVSRPSYPSFIKCFFSIFAMSRGQLLCWEMYLRCFSDKKQVCSDKASLPKWSKVLKASLSISWYFPIFDINETP